MKKIYATIWMTLSAATAMAQLNGNGFYRLRNYVTSRYAYVIDNRASVSIATTSADLAAIDLNIGKERAASDPATVIYLSNMGDAEGIQYDIQAQGASVYAMLGYSLKIKKNADGTYYAYESKSGLTSYLTDDPDEKDINETTTLSTEGTGAYRKWYILPIASDAEEYFGVLPEVQVGDKYYATLYAAFPFRCASSGMKVYAVSQLKGGKAQYEELTDWVPAGTPVLIECSSADASSNRLDIQKVAGTAPMQNLLSGVYFCSRYTRPAAPHYNRQAYDPNTMRTLGVLSDGSLGFVKSDLQWLPANKAYLVVPTDTPDEVKLVDADDFSAIATVEQDPAGSAIYTLTGLQVRSNAVSLEGLSSGIYVKDGKKIVIR